MPARSSGVNRIQDRDRVAVDAARARVDFRARAHPRADALAPMNGLNGRRQIESHRILALLERSEADSWNQT